MSIQVLKKTELIAGLHPPPEARPIFQRLVASPEASLDRELDNVNKKRRPE
jgi:hypothetical protein